MPGRNDLCPCGSGLKYKKCCIHLKVVPEARKQVSTPVRRIARQDFSFTGIASTEYAEDLTLLPIAKTKDLVKAAFNYLEQNSFESFDIDFDHVNCVSVRLVFSDPNHSSIEEENYNRNYLSHFYKNDEVEIFLTEMAPDGLLKVEVFRNQVLSDISSNLPEVNAAVIFLWLSLSRDIDRENLPKPVEEFHSAFQQIPKRRKRLELERHLLSEELRNISLISLSLSIEPVLADGRSIYDFDQNFKLPDQFNYEVSKERRVADEFLFSNSILNRKKWNLPEIFFSHNKAKHPAAWHNDNFLRSVTGVISYHFSDGVALDARQILTSKYALLLAPDLLPGSVIIPEAEPLWTKTFAKSPKPESDDFNPTSSARKTQGILAEVEIVSRDRGSFFLGDTDVVKTTRLMSDLVERVAARLSRGEIKLNLKWIGDSSKNCLQLSAIDTKVQTFSWETEFVARPFDHDPRYSIIAGQLSLSNSLKKNPKGEAETLALKSGFVNLAARSFRLQPLSKTLQAWSDLRFGYASQMNFPDRKAISCEFSTWPELAVTLTAEGAKNFKILKQNLSARNEDSFVLSGHLSRESVTVQSELHLDAEGRFFLLRRIFQVDPETRSGAASLEFPFVSGLSFSTLNLLKVFSEGIPAHFNNDARLMASKSSPKREFELKLLKHLGIANLLVFEMLSIRFQGALSDGKLVKKSSDVLALLEPKILALLGDSVKQSSLQELCSKQVYSKLKSFVTDLYHQFDTTTKKNGLDHILLPEGEFAIPKILEDELRLIYALLSHAAVASNGDIFAKARLNFLSKIFLFEAYRLNECNFLNSRERISLENRSQSSVSFQLPYLTNKSGALLSTLAAFQPLLKSGFEFYLKGQRIQELQASEFQTEMTVSELLTTKSTESTASAKNTGPAARGKNTGLINWFELNPKFFLHGTEIQIHQVGQFLRDGIIEHGGKFYLVPANRLPSLKRLSSFWERLQAGKKLGSGFALTEQIYQVPKSQVLEMLALRSSGVSVLGGARWNQICEFYDGLDSDKAPLSLPTSIRAELKPYQKIGIQWLYELYHLGLGAVLADDMGLGKTLQTLAFLEKLREEKTMGSVLIVVPTSLTYNWLSEKDKFVPESRMQVFSSKTKDEAFDFLSKNSHATLLTTYGMMQEHKEFFQNVKWNIVIFDEAQNLKTITTQRATVARALKSQIKICLTGTPLENHLGELYSILDLAAPGCLGDVDEFRKVFVNPPSIEADDLRFLKLKSKPLILRRTKQQILSELPDKTESRVSLDFEISQKKIYRDIAISYNHKIQETISNEGEGKCQLQMLTALLRLRQACSDPSALPGITYKNTPPKLETLKEALIEIVDSGESALVFTQFLRTLERTETLLKDANIPTFTIHGGLSQSARAKILREFNERIGGAVLVMTLKTGGVGLNLAKASYVFHLEPWWNPAVENQATDRAHRMGQRRAVQVYRYIMHESVEEKIEILKQRKQMTFNAVFSDLESLGSDMNAEERIDTRGSFLSKDDFNFLLSTDS